MSRPRVVHVATVAPTIRHLLLPQLRGIRDRGFDVTTISAPGSDTAILPEEGIRHIPWLHATRAWDPAADAKAFAELLRIFRRERFDIVHTHTPKPAILGRWAAARAGVPVVVNTVHGLYATPDDHVLKRWTVLGLERWAARRSHLELFQSEEDLAWARRLDVVLPWRSDLLGNGVDIGRFDPSAVEEERRMEIRRELEIPEDAVVVGTVGRLVEEKGYREFVEAARAVTDAVPQARFLAVGPPDLAKRDAVSDVDLSRADSIRFTGWREDVRDLLAVMDVFVLASWREGVPRSAIEAAAMERPLVLTDIRGCREVARHEQEGLLVPPRDPDRLADAILRLIRDGDLRARLGRAARARAGERFDERAVIDRVVDHYGRALRSVGLRADPVVLDGFGEVRIRPARPGEETIMARLHRQTHPDAFLPRLGDRFLRLLYRAQIDDPDAVALVADSGGRVIGYSTGLRSTSRFRRRFVRRHGAAAALAVAPRLVRAGVLRRALEVARYPDKVSELPEAEWAFVALDPRIRARGLGTLLGRTMVEALAARGADAIKTFVALENEASNRMVQRLGFEPRGRISIHDGTPSNLYVIRCSS